MDRIPQKAFDAGAQLKYDPNIGTMLDEIVTYVDREAGSDIEEDSGAELPLPEPDTGVALRLGWVATVASGDHVFPRRYYAQAVERIGGDDVPGAQETVQYDVESGRLTGIIGEGDDYITDPDVLRQLIEKIHTEFESTCGKK